MTPSAKTFLGVNSKNFQGSDKLWLRGASARGFSRIKALGYKEHEILAELEYHYRMNDIRQKFIETFKVGMRMTTDDIKRKMCEIYQGYGISKKGVATHLDKEYGIRMREVKITMTDGYRKRGYEFV